MKLKTIKIQKDVWNKLEYIQTILKKKYKIKANIPQIAIGCIGFVEENLKNEI